MNIAPLLTGAAACTAVWVSVLSAPIPKAPPIIEEPSFDWVVEQRRLEYTDDPIVIVEDHPEELVVDYNIDYGWHEYADLIDNMTDEDYEALEQVCYHESVRAFSDFEDGEFETTVEVVETVFNRAVNTGKSVYNICHAKNQFVCKPYKGTQAQEEAISDAISYVINEGRTILPGSDYEFFATKKQSLGKDHVWIGQTNNGKPVKGKGMYFCREK